MHCFGSNIASFRREPFENKRVQDEAIFITFTLLCSLVKRISCLTKNPERRLELTGYTEESLHVRNRDPTKVVVLTLEKELQPPG